MIYIIPAVILGGCGILAGVLLTVASKVFHVEVDERVEKIGNSLPQANCGACGFAGCADYADAIVNNNASTNLCCTPKKRRGMANRPSPLLFL